MEKEIINKLVYKQELIDRKEIIGKYCLCDNKTWRIIEIFDNGFVELESDEIVIATHITFIFLLPGNVIDKE